MNTTSSSSLSSKISQRITHIKNNTTSGATEITIDGVKTLLLLLEKMKTSSIETTLQQIQTTLHQIINAQPLMASLFTYVNNTLLFLQQNQFETNSELKTKLFDHSKSFLEALQTGNDLISNHATSLIPKQATIYTYSHSSTVRETIMSASKQGKQIKVHCSESRPKHEGIDLAKKLTAEAIPTVLSTDAALFSTIRHADLLLIGADAITTEGIVHKIGSLSLVQLAAQYHIPVYSLSVKEKMLPSSYQLPKESSKNPADITSEDIPYLQVANYFFDYSPLHLFTNIVTQKGVFSPQAIEQSMNQLPLHYSLKK